MIQRCGSLVAVVAIRHFWMRIASQRLAILGRGRRYPGLPRADRAEGARGLRQKRILASGKLAVSQSRIFEF
jgi:hypothetical protein